jgi:hypothetical protein
VSGVVRDTRRSDTYAAEDAAFEGTVLEAKPGGPTLEGAATTILASAWWRTNVGDPAVVRRIQVRTALDSHWSPHSATLAIDPGEPWYVITHELAHVAAGTSGSTEEEVHGPRWRGWNVALVEAAFGEPFARLLAASWGRFELAADAPTTAPPPAALITLPSVGPTRGGWRPAR